MPKISINPVKPVAPYLGANRNLAGRICPLIDGDDHQTYAEPFVGMGGIFLRRKRQPRSEVINDYSRDVANLFVDFTAPLVARQEAAVYGASSLSADHPIRAQTPG